MNDSGHFFLRRQRMLPTVSLRPQQKRKLEQVKSNRHTRSLARSIGRTHVQILPGSALRGPTEGSAEVGQPQSGAAALKSDGW